MNRKQQFFTAIALVFLGFCLPLSFAHATSCATAQSGDITLTSSCTFDGTNDGAVGGNITIAADVTLTILAGQNLVVNQGNSFVITATGAMITIIDTGNMLIGRTICLTDGDADTYPASIAASDQTLTATTCGAGTIVRSAATWQSDCNDASASYFAALTCYADADSDTYYSITSQSVCGGATTCAGLSPAQSATVGTDCCDTDANAKPGQTAYFTTARTTCGGYDYDCDASSLETLDSTGINAATYVCTNPCNSCSLDYSVTPGWLTAPPATCGGSGTKYSMNGSYVSGTCYTAACATLATGVAAQRGCH
ncbi:MAG: hypothetical protein WAV51_00015 [Microgenomates group bacterium]